MLLKTGVIHSLFIVFSQSLDGFEEIVGDGKERRAVRTLFALGAIRLDIAVNANKLKPIVQGFEEARNALIAQLSGGKATLEQDDDPEKFDKYQSDLKEMVETEHDVDIKPLSKAALRLDINPIPVQALMILAENDLLVD